MSDDSTLPPATPPPPPLTTSDVRAAFAGQIFSQAFAACHAAGLDLSESMTVVLTMVAGTLRFYNGSKEELLEAASIAWERMDQAHREGRLEVVVVSPASSGGSC